MKVLLLAVLSLPLLSIAAEDEESSFKISGFYNLTGAKILSGSALGSSEPWNYMQWKCPCSIQNWEYTGVYEKEKGWQFDQESLIGLQIKKEFSPTFSATAQLVMRANNPNENSKPTVDWAYLSWNPSADSPWTLQAGRFRIPLYYYSDYLYIGYAYPWVRPAPDVYGWPIYAYDGVNATYRHQLGESEWNVAASVWTGQFTQKNDAYYTRFYYSTPTNDKWKNIIGSYVTLSNGSIDLRAMYMQHKESVWQDGEGGTNYLLRDQPTKIMGVSANLDYKNWIVKSEFDRFEQVDKALGINNVYKYALFGVGYNWGNWTPMYTYSQYTTVAEPIEARRTHYLSLRWDFRKNTALKLQYDISKDRSKYPYKFIGDSRVLSVSLQGTF